MKNSAKLAALVFTMALAYDMGAQGLYIPDNPANSMYTISHSRNVESANEYVSGVSTVYTSGKPADEYVGNRYLQENFQKGAIYFSDSTTLVDVMLRYNVYEQSMDIVFDGDTASIKPTYKIDAYYIGDKIFIHSLIFDDWKREFSQSYFELLEKGKAMLLKRYEKALVHNSFTKYYGGGGGDGRYHYIDKEDLYYKKGREAAVKLKKKKSKILEIFDDHRSEISDFIKEEDISLRKEEDLEKLFRYYNSL